MGRNKLLSWIIFAVTSTIIVAFMICIAEAAYGINQQMNEQQANQQVNAQYAKNKVVSNLITGMDTSTAGIVMLIVGIIMAIVAILMILGIGFFAKSGGCFAAAHAPGMWWLYVLCIGLLVVAILLVIFGAIMMSKASDVSSGSGASGASGDSSTGGSMQSNVQNQASTNKN